MRERFAQPSVDLLVLELVREVALSGPRRDGRERIGGRDVDAGLLAHL